MTDPILHDIRLLKLAEMYERSYERFVLEMAAQFPEDDDVQEHLRQLVGGEDDHGARITTELSRLNAEAGDLDPVLIQRAALMDVVEVERTAREFYIKNADRAHDPAVASLFREMAREESQHIRLAEDALALVMRRPAKPAAPEP